MTSQVSSHLTGMLLVASALLMTACATGEAGLAAPTAGGPLPSPRSAFTGLAMPATLAAPSRTGTPAATKQSGAASSKTTALTILYTNDTRGYVDPCG
jgi:hypothetical protein